MIWSLVGSIGVGALGWVLYAFAESAKATAELDSKLQRAVAEKEKHDKYAAEDRSARLERVVFQLKEEVKVLNEELDLCDVPGAVRDRLNKMSARLANPHA